MKIRAGFVTNSSSFSSVNLTVSCAPLVEIINKYKKVLKLDGLVKKHFDSLTKKDKFIYQESEDGGIIKGRNIRDFMSDLIGDIFHYLLFRSIYYTEEEEKHYAELFKPMIKELEDNLETIIASTTKVSYDLEQTFYGLDMPEHKHQFVEIHPDKEYEDYVMGKYTSSFVYVNKDGEIEEEFEQDFEAD